LKHTSLHYRFLAVLALQLLIAGNLLLQGVGPLTADVAAEGAAAGEAAAGATDKCKDRPLACPPEGIYLLQPLNDNPGQTLAAKPGIQIAFDYFNMAWPWLLGVAAGIAVLRAVWAGMKIMLSGGDIDEAKEELLWALGGLVILGLAGFILRTLNPTFYT
jgi:hypothetical protein